MVQRKEKPPSAHPHGRIPITRPDQRASPHRHGRIPIPTGGSPSHGRTNGRPLIATAGPHPHGRTPSPRPDPIPRPDPRPCQSTCSSPRPCPRPCQSTCSSPRPGPRSYHPHAQPPPHAQPLPASTAEPPRPFQSPSPTTIRHTPSQTTRSVWGHVRTSLLQGSAGSRLKVSTGRCQKKSGAVGALSRRLKDSSAPTCLQTVLLAFLVCLCVA